MRQANISDLEFLKKLRSETMDEYLKKEGLPIDETSHLKRIKYHFESANISNIHGKPIGLFKCYDTYYSGCCDKDLKKIETIKKELKL